MGRQAIKSFNLAIVKHFPSHFMESEAIEEKILSVVEDKPEKTLFQISSKLFLQRCLIEILETSNYLLICTQDKVQRWFKCFQGFDFEIEGVKSIHNSVADYAQ